LNKALALAPERGEGHLAAAWLAYHLERDYKTALAELAIARRSLPNDASIPELTGYIARRQGQWQLSIENFARAAELDPQNAFLLQQLCHTYQPLRRYPELARTLDRAIAASPGDPTSRVARALVDLEACADVQPAREVIQELVREDPSVVDAIAEQWFYVGLCQRDVTDIGRALASITLEGIVPINVRMPRTFCEGVAARALGDESTA
jgi:tetratricopeptide (TPR) repeat protein